MNEPTAWVTSATILRSLYDITAPMTAMTVASWKSILATRSAPCSCWVLNQFPSLAPTEGFAPRPREAALAPATAAATARESLGLPARRGATAVDAETRRGARARTREAPAGREPVCVGSGGTWRSALGYFFPGTAESGSARRWNLHPTQT